MPGCNTKANNGLYNFPANENVRLQWINLTQTFYLDPAKVKSSFYRVCRLHFRDCDFEDFFGKLRLVKNAVPSQLLPDFSEPNESVKF